MALVDDIIIRVKAGDGGFGGKSFSQNPGTRGTHPDGGDGGRGGDIYVEGSTNLNDLSQFRFKKVITADNGVNGLNKNLNGKKGDDITILVPLGTKVTDTKTNQTIEILEKGKKVIVAAGGLGKIGNHNEKVESRRNGLVSDIQQTGEERELHLILNLIADIGLIGLPNAGKSSLLTQLTRATPKIGNYPFTTLEPNLGIMSAKTQHGKDVTVALADIPGLVEGASAGKGLGIQFLKHIQKTKMLLHCIDATTENVVKAYNTIRGEFEKYDKSLLEKDEIILLTKVDLLEEGQMKTKINELKTTGRKIIPLSIYDPESIETLKVRIRKIANS